MNFDLGGVLFARRQCQLGLATPLLTEEMEMEARGLNKGVFFSFSSPSPSLLISYILWRFVILRGGLWNNSQLIGYLRTVECIMATYFDLIVSDK